MAFKVTTSSAWPRRDAATASDLLITRDIARFKSREAGSDRR
jgi:hypothetical protein